MYDWIDYISADRALFTDAAGETITEVECWNQARCMHPWPHGVQRAIVRGQGDLTYCRVCRAVLGR